jgi:glycosyltransferase-like protein
MKIALLTHSVNPRGGVVHTLELGTALAALGHDVTLMAPAAPGQSFFRSTALRVSLASIAPYPAGVVAMVQARIDAYVQHLDAVLAHERFDVLHAQDSISGNALAELTQAGTIPDFVRTVHHLDAFDDERLSRWQTLAFAQAKTVCCVSATWVEHMRERYGIDAQAVTNGIDPVKFNSVAEASDAIVAARYRIRHDAPVFLAVGGVEERKNTLAILEAFAHCRAAYPHAQLVIAGGASLLDHDDYARRFHARLFALGFGGADRAQVVVTGSVADADMPALYRLANVLVMPSLKEGFGLAVLEALASGTPAVVSAIRPFTEHLNSTDVFFADPNSIASIGDAMIEAVGCIPDARNLLARFSWAASAECHLALYRRHIGSRQTNPLPQGGREHARHALHRSLA